MTKKMVDVVPYNPSWPKIFEVCAKEIRKALDENVIEVHHIGSTSIPGLCSKPRIDIMCVVKDLKAAVEPLELIGFKNRGEFRHLPLRLFFSKREEPDLNLHIVKENNGEIERSLCFRDYLRKNKEARDMYGAVKLKLIEENQDGFEMIKNQIFSNYATQKTEVIMRILKMAGYSGYRLIEATEKNETNSFKMLLHLEKVNFDNPHVFRMYLYKGIDLVAAIFLKFNEDFSKAKIEKINAIDNKSKIVMLDKINKWLKFKDTTLYGEV